MASGYIGMASLVLAWAIKLLWWQRADKTGRDADGSSLASATGLTGYASVKLFEAPHLTKNYLMKEMVFEIGRRHGKKLRYISMGLGFVVAFFAGAGRVFWRACNGVRHSGFWFSYDRAVCGALAVFCRSRTCGCALLRQVKISKKCYLKIVIAAAPFDRFIALLRL